MALHLGDENEQTPTSSGATQPTLGDSGRVGVIGSGIGMLGFGQGPVNIISATAKGSEYSKAMTDKLKEMLKSQPEAERPKVLLMDNQIMSGLCYSTILVYVKSLDGKKINYIPVSLTATGSRGAVRAVDMANEIKNNAASNGKQAQFEYQYVPADAIDDDLRTMAVDAIAKAENNPHVDCVAISNLTVPAEATVDDPVVMAILTITRNALFVDQQLDAYGPEADMNVIFDKQDCPSRYFTAEVAINRGNTASTLLGNPVRADFSLNLLASSKQENLQRYGTPNLNSRPANILFARAHGYVDAVMSKVPGQVVNGMVQPEAMRLSPYLVLSDLYTDTPSLGHTLLALSAATVMTDKRCYIAALIGNESSPAADIGVLNMITALGNDPTPLALNDSKVDLKNKTTIIEQMFSQPLLLAMDIELGGLSYYQLSPLVAAAVDKNESALQFIVDTAVHLTNGVFPANYPLDKIIGSYIPVPLGHYESGKAGTRDIRDIDLAAVAKNSNGTPEQINAYDLSQLPREITGFDPFSAKAQIVANYTRDAVITGKAVRITFRTEFIDTLNKALAACGVSFGYDPALQITAAVDFGQYNGGLLSASGLNNINTVGRVNGFGNNGFNAPSTYMASGVNRFYR